MAGDTSGYTIPEPMCTHCNSAVGGIHVDELAKRAGLKTYDLALPLQWYEDVHDTTGFWPQRYGFVWCYDSPTVWGAPYPLTESAEILLAFYNQMLDSMERECTHDDESE